MTDKERLKQLELKVENLEFKYEKLLLDVKASKQMPNPMAFVGTGYDDSNDIYKSKGELMITRKEITEICRRGYDKKYIDKIIQVIFEKYSEHYETLSYAIKQWIAVDTNRPDNENEFLVNNGGFPPVAEQQRLFPGKGIIDMAYIQRAFEKVNWKEREAQWRKEIEEEEQKKTPEQKAKDKSDREKLLNRKSNSIGISKRMKAKIEASGLSYQEFVDYSKIIKK
jgi:hypothetical protein